jgi:hypothetical protein
MTKFTIALLELGSGEIMAAEEFAAGGFPRRGRGFEWSR